VQASEEGYESIRLSTNWSSASFDHAIVLILSRDSGDVRNNQEWLGKAACDFVDPIKNFGMVRRLDCVRTFGTQLQHGSSL
jgi:hypothetical protein